MDLINYAEPVAKYLGATVALLAFIKGVVEFTTQNRIKKYEKYKELRDEFRTNSVFLEMRTLLELDDNKIGTISYEKKVRFLGFYEDVFIMINNKLLSEDLAYYMFGYYAIRCYRSKVFWEDMERDSIYWKEFRRFAERMVDIENLVACEQRLSRWC